MILYSINEKIVKFIIKLTNKIKNRYFVYIYEKRVHKTIYNFYKKNYKKRAALIYSPVSFIFHKNHKWYLRDTLYERNRIVAEILNSNNYIVDIYEWTINNYENKFNYDLVIDHGNLHKKICDSQKINPFIISFLATSYYEFNNNAEIKRINNFIERNQINTLPKRQLNKMNLDLCDVILLHGNKETKNTYPDKFHRKIHTIPNYPFSFLISDIKKKYDDKIKKTFLYFGSSLGQIHKGLDLLIEVFLELKNLNLYICGKFEKEEELKKIYLDKIMKSDNIFLTGWILPNSDMYKEIISKSGFVILPSCSEGIAGGVINCMASGLIPVVSKNSGIDIEKTGYLINDSIKDIKKQLNEIIKVECYELELQSEEAIRQVSNMKKNFKEIIAKHIKTVN